MVSKHKNPSKGIFVTVDETEDPHNTYPDIPQYYVAVATVVDDRIGFRNIVDSLDIDRELGYSDDKRLTPLIINESLPFVRKVYVARMSKTDPRYLEMSAKNRHYTLMRYLRGMLPYAKDDDVFVMVDQKSGIDSNEIKRIFADIDGKKIVERNSHYCIVAPSNWFSELQVHDYYTGIIGSYINKEEETYIDSLDGHWEMKTFNKKGRNRGRSLTGNKSTATSNRAHPPGGSVSGSYLGHSSSKYKNSPSKKQGKAKKKTDDKKKVVKKSRKSTN